MNKVNNNIKKKESSMVDVLKENGSLNQKVKIDDVYGVFLKNNTFVICEESLYNIHGYILSELHDFFTGKIIARDVMENLYGRKNFILTCSCEEAITVPFGKFFKKVFVTGMTTKKTVALLFDEVNKYIKENPALVAELFKEPENKYPLSKRLCYMSWLRKIKRC